LSLVRVVGIRSWSIVFLQVIKLRPHGSCRSFLQVILSLVSVIGIWSWCVEFCLWLQPCTHRLSRPLFKVFFSLVNIVGIWRRSLEFVSHLWFQSKTELNASFQKVFRLVSVVSVGGRNLRNLCIFSSATNCLSESTIFSFCGETGCVVYVGCWGRTLHLHFVPAGEAESRRCRLVGVGSVVHSNQARQADGCGPRT